MSEYLIRRIEQLAQEKQAYFSKVLSESAIFANVQRTRDVGGYFGEQSFAQTMYFIWLNISGMFIFGLDPRELEPLDPEFEVSLPSEKEWLAGVKLKITPVSLDDAWAKFWQEVFKTVVPPKADYWAFVEKFFKEKFWDDLLRRRYGKLIVGQTKYGEGYIDPQVVRDFLRATLYKMHNQRIDFPRTKTLFEEVAAQFGIDAGVVEGLFNRFALHFQSIFTTFFLGYNLLGYSPLAKRGSDATLVPVVTWRGEEVEAHVRLWQEVNMGFILGVTPLGMGMLTPPEDVYEYVTDKLTPYITAFVDWKTRKQIERFPATPAAFGNYQRPDEALSPWGNDRLEHWAETRALADAVASIADAVAEQAGVDAFRRNLYRRAAAMLVGYRKKRHVWGYDAWRNMSEEEFKAWWLAYWEKQGLNINLLNSIYDKVSVCLNQIRNRSLELGQRVKRRKYAQALLP